jgi:hypothetical protein
MPWRPALAPVRWRAITTTSVARSMPRSVGGSGGRRSARYLYLGMVATIAVVVDVRTLTMPNVLLLSSYPIGIGLLAARRRISRRAVVAVRAGPSSPWPRWPASTSSWRWWPEGGEWAPTNVALGVYSASSSAGVSWSVLSTGVIFGWLVALGGHRRLSLRPTGTGRSTSSPLGRVCGLACSLPCSLRSSADRLGRGRSRACEQCRGGLVTAHVVGVDWRRSEPQRVWRAQAGPGSREPGPSASRSRMNSPASMVPGPRRPPGPRRRSTSSAVIGCWQDGQHTVGVNTRPQSRCR